MAFKNIALLLLVVVTFTIIFSFCFAEEAPPPLIIKPNALILPVLKDNQTSLHVAQIYTRTPLKPFPFLVDLKGKFLAINCQENYSSSTYNAPFCHSTQCAKAGPHYCHKCQSTSKPGCHNNTCAVQTSNPLTNRNVQAEISEDVIALEGLNPGPPVIFPGFLFACVQSSVFLQGPFPKNVQGVSGFGHDPVSLPQQLSSHFGFPSKFALCLSSQNNKNGVIFFGNTTYMINQSLHYTPLAIGPQGEYVVLVKSIRINHKDLQLNKSLISRTRSFGGGVVISTTKPYTVLESAIYTTFIQSFTREFLGFGVKQVDAISPFGACFKNLKQEPKTGINEAPTIEFVMQNRNMSWKFYSPNTLVEARKGIWCLAFVEAGQNPRASIVIGTHQLEDNIVEFDLGTSKLGFSDSLRLSNASCAQFNFTTRTQVFQNSGMIPQEEGYYMFDETIDHP